MELKVRLEHADQISTLFKSEYSNLVAVLCRYYGMDNLQIAEDVISDTFVKAMKSWSHNGIPDQPRAWLRRVAANKLTDHYRRQQTYRDKALPGYHKSHEGHRSIQVQFSDQYVEDSQLRMIFVVCHPDLNMESQICLALRVLCSLNIGEIASALLTNKDNINKKLHRAKKKLQTHTAQWQNLEPKDYPARLDAVLRIIYLIFNEGYYSNSADKEVRNELCSEAMRLCIFLLEQAALNLPKVNALLALMCMHASRLESRVDDSGQYVLYHDQDKSLWDKALIAKGEKYLSISAQGKEVSKYHLEAAIAYWHTGDDPDKWSHILQLYNKLLIIEFSPMAALNRTYALAKANSVGEAIEEALKLKFKDNHFYYSLLAELYGMQSDVTNQIKYLDLAIALAKKPTEIDLLQRKRKSAVKKRKPQ